MSSSPSCLPRPIGFAIALAIVPLGSLRAADEGVVFNRDIRPILSDRCFHCHGPDEHERKAKLRLDQTGGDEGAYRTLDGITAIQPGSVEDSEVWHRIISSDPDEVMPPPKAHKAALTERERALFRQWIEEGASYQDFWAFVPPTMPELPEPEDEPAAWSEHPIDRLVLARLESEELEPSPRADRRTLIRRLSFDLTGLPPTREEIAAFLADEKPGAWERLVDRLLAKPQYGEHLTKYWLDLVRFADTNGIHHDHYRELTPYRDWVIRAFNDNLGYDEFVKYQLAGDLYPEPSRDQLIASGFHRLHLIIDVGTALPEESYTRNVIDRVSSVGTAFLGLTVQCAVCHDHKYDPITARDFFSLFAFFNNLDAEPETGRRAGTDFRRGLQPPFIELATHDQTERLAGLTAAADAASARVDELKKQIASAADAQQKKALSQELKQAEERQKSARTARDEYEISLPAAMVMRERAEPRPAYILVRGAYDQPGEQVERDTPSFLPPLPERSSDEPRSRMELAEWFVAPEHPLTARVAVNRFWQQLFGTGLVKTSEDFGAQGEWPSHPELLDYLAVRFVESGWDIKALFKDIVMSETYRQSSVATPEALAADPENRLLARGSRFRMDSEMIRDQLLATSGLLNDELYGKSVKPPQPEGLWKSVGMPSSFPNSFVPDSGEAIFRRSVYTFWKRGMPPPQMTILNAPTREECIARRERTNTPLQALLLLNEAEYLKAARHLALDTLVDPDAPRESTGRVALLYETITSHLPDSAETAAFVELAAELETLYTERPELAAELSEGATIPDGSSPAEVAAWTTLVSSLYNLDVTKTRQ